MAKVDLESKWAENVKRAKEICSLKNENQMAVAGLALDVCEISWGGKSYAGKFTLKRFAVEIGMSDRKLSQWISVRKNVYEKLPEDDRLGVSYTKLVHVATRVTRDSSKKFVQEKFDELAKGDPFEPRMLRCLADLRTAAYNFEQKDAADKLSIATQEEFLFFCQVVSRNILKKHKGLKGADHGLAGKNSVTNMSAAQALGIERPLGDGSRRIKVNDEHGSVVITPKDRDIAAFLRKKDKFFSPTEIGMKLGKRNENSSTAWSHRTLNKLLSLGMVERNRNGHYRWIGSPTTDIAA
jgi:hypothetical protein